MINVLTFEASCLQNTQQDRLSETHTHTHTQSDAITLTRKYTHMLDIFKIEKLQQEKDGILLFSFVSHVQECCFLV